MAVQRTNKAVSIAILGGCDCSFRLDNRVDAADCLEVSTEQNGRGIDGAPRLATSVDISKRRWFLTSRVRGVPEAEDILMSQTCC